MIKIIIADDHKMFVHGLTLLLQSNSTFQIVGTANNGLEVKDLLEKNEIDIVIMDINMPKLNGYETTLLITKLFPAVSIIALSMLNDQTSILKMLEAGVKGYLFKNTDEQELIKAIETVYAGGYYVNDDAYEVYQLFIKNEKNREKGIITYKKHALSVREIDVLKHILEGFTNQEIAEKIFLSQHTIDTHRKNMLTKLGLKNTASLIRYAMENKAFLNIE